MKTQKLDAMAHFVLEGEPTEAGSAMGPKK